MDNNIYLRYNWNPKGAVLDYRTVFLTKIIIESEVNPLAVDKNGNNTFISYMPLNHIFERVVIEFSCLKIWRNNIIC